jgi:hypothetical protein
LALSTNLAEPLGESGLLRADSLKIWSTFLVSTGSYPSLNLDTTGVGTVSRAGTTLLVDTMNKIGLEQVLSAGLSRWRGLLATRRRQPPRPAHPQGLAALGLRQTRAAARPGAAGQSPRRKEKTPSARNRFLALIEHMFYPAMDRILAHTSTNRTLE